jgi:hypothetical protein
MTDESAKFLQKLFDSQDINATLRASYRNELDALTSPRLTWRKALPGIVLLLVLLVCVLGIVRNLFVYDPEPLILVSWLVLAVSFSWISFLIARDLWRRKHSPQAAFSIGHILLMASGAITVASLLMGLNAPNEPASMFNAFFVFVFYFSCFTLALENRIAAAELAAKEQMLRIEFRLADLAEKMGRAE